MIVLGVSDLPAPAAAVALDGAIAAAVGGDDLPDAWQGDDPFPWPAVDAALRTAGVRREEVGTVAVAGRYTAPWALRRSRRLAGLADLRLTQPVRAAWQMALRATGLGAFAADVTAERLDARLHEAGFTRAHVVMVDAHRALAEAAYRTQDADDLLVVSVHPLGDGNALAVHRGQGGMLDRLEEQAGSPSLHAHLGRVHEALALSADDPDHLDGLAGRGRPDPDLVALLARDLHAEGARLASDAAQGADELVRRLRGTSPEDAAASVVANLGDAVAAVVRRQARALGVRRVALVGALAELPRVVGAVAEFGEIDALVVPPRAGRDALALGAACGLAGVGPARRGWRHGPEPDDEDLARELAAGVWQADASVDVVAHLVAGEGVLWWTGRAGEGTAGLGDRAVLVRADRKAAVEAVRAGLGLPSWVEPLLLVAPDALDPGPATAALHAAAVALRAPAGWDMTYPHALAPDGRVRPLLVAEGDAPALAQLLARTSQAGVAGLLAWPLRDTSGHRRTTVAQATASARAAGVQVARVGPLTLRRGGRA